MSTSSVLPWPRAARWWCWLAVLAALVGTGCPATMLPLRPEFQTAVERHDALGLSEQLEKLIDSGLVTDDDREAAYQAVKRWELRTAEYAYARAALTGRLAQVRGLSAIGLVREVEAWTLESINRDPNYQQGAATRLLGSLYVLAPSTLLSHGDSEKGLGMLERLCKRHPETLENHLRVAEAYIALGDPEPATPHLCRCERERASLRPSDQRVLDKLIKDAGGAAVLACPAAPPPARGAAPQAPTAAPAAPTATPAAPTAAPAAPTAAPAAPTAAPAAPTAAPTTSR
jgi:hypothetical protein